MAEECTAPADRVNHLRGAVSEALDACEPADPAEPGKVRAANFSGIAAKARDALARLDAQIQQFGPVIQTMTPIQYQAYEAMVFALIHTINGGLNPAPAPQ